MVVVSYWMEKEMKSINNKRKAGNMRKLLCLITFVFMTVGFVFAQDDYYIKKTRGYQHEAAYYTKKGNLDRAQSYTRYANRAMDNYKTQLRYAGQADEKATMYLRWAAEALSKQ